MKVKVTTPDLFDPLQSLQVSGRMERIQQALNDGASTPFTISALPPTLTTKAVNDHLFRLGQEAGVTLHPITALTALQVNDRLRRLESKVGVAPDVPVVPSRPVRPRYGRAVYGLSKYSAKVN